MLSMYHFTYDLYLSLGKFQQCFCPMGSCSILALVCSQPWKAGTRMCHLYGHLLSRNQAPRPDVREEDSETSTRKNDVGPLSEPSDSWSRYSQDSCAPLGFRVTAD